jgi:thiol-disulfide isomerase/thioredoxin
LHKHILDLKGFTVNTFHKIGRSNNVLHFYFYNSRLVICKSLEFCKYFSILKTLVELWFLDRLSLTNMKTCFAIAFLIFAVVLNAQEVRSIKVTELEKTIKESNAPLIVNFWATFCVPCLEEIPYFQELAQQKNVSLVFVSLDLKSAYPARVNETAKKLKLLYPVVWLNETNADYFCPKVDTSWTGGMPSSLFINNATGYHRFFEQQLSKEQLTKEIEAMIRQ